MTSLGLSSVGRAVIVHGWTANPTQHWFPWLKATLVRAGIKVVVPALPNPMNPDCDKWVAAVREAIGNPGTDVLVVAHSLGCITTLRALDGISGEWQLGGLFLVSGFDEALSHIPHLDPFTEAPSYQPELMAKRCLRRAVICSDNDTIVNPGHTQRLAEHLAADCIEISGMGHFCDFEGVTEIPQLLDLIKKHGVQ